MGGPQVTPPAAPLVERLKEAQGKAKEYAVIAALRIYVSQAYFADLAALLEEAVAEIEKWDKPKSSSMCVCGDKRYRHDDGEGSACNLCECESFQLA